MPARGSRPRRHSSDRLRPGEGANDGFDFNPRDYTIEELEVLEAALKLMVEKREEKEKVRALRGDSR